MRTIAYALVVVFVVTIPSCMDNPVQPDEEHDEAEGLILRGSSGADVVSIEGNAVTGHISITKESVAGPFTVAFLDSDGDEFVPADAEETLFLSVSNTNVAALQDVDESPWSFRLVGVSAGTTSIVIGISHGSHTDYESPPVEIRVAP